MQLSRIISPILAALALAAAPLPAQDTPAPAAPAAVRYARVVVDQQPVRCFASEVSPVFLDKLAKDAIVQVGAEENGYVAVSLPLGLTGYVHKKYGTAPDAAGFIKAVGKRVSFRYRPRSNEAPAQMLDDGTPLHFMGDEGEWYVVRNPRASGYVPVGAVALDVDEGAAKEQWGKFEVERRAQWEKLTQERVAAAAAEEAAKVLRGELQELLGRFKTESKKVAQEQKRSSFQAIEASLKALAGKIPAGSSEALTASSLQEELHKQFVVLDAQALVKETPPPPRPSEQFVKPSTADPLARYDLVGWVRVVSSPLPSRTVRVVRGGRVLGYLTCSSGRYDLSMFENVEVGVLGPKEAASDGTWLLDVQRLDVLNVAQ